MCLTAKNFGLQEENINISNPQGKPTNFLRKRDGVPKKEREKEMDRKDKYGGRNEEVLYEKAG